MGMPNKDVIAYAVDADTGRIIWVCYGERKDNELYLRSAGAIRHRPIHLGGHLDSGTVHLYLSNRCPSD